MNEFKQKAQNSANAEKTWPISSAITERTVTYVQMSVKLLFSAYIWLKSKSVLLLNAGQRFSDSEWIRILKAGDLVVLGVSCGPVWYCCLTCANLY